MMKPTDMTKTTDEVIDRFDRAFQERDATLLMDIIAPDCVMESVQPAPDGTRYERVMTLRSAGGRRSSTTPPATPRSRTSTPATSGRSSWPYVWGPAPTTQSVA
jgi:hypothetical protein